MTNNHPSSTARCPACGGGQPEPVMSVDRVPLSCAQLFPTLEAAKAATDCRLEVMVCPSCGHLWNDAHADIEEAIYNDDYYSSFTHSPQARSYQESLARDLDGLIGVSGKTVLEVGCGDGFFLHTLASLGAHSIGYEPSSTYTLAAEHREIEVHHQYFSFDPSQEEGDPADVIVMRHVLEHLMEPKEVLTSLSKKRFQNGHARYLLIEVPNSLQLLRDNLYFDFYNDHVHYFSEGSLRSVLKSAGWTHLAGIQSDGEFVRLLSVNTRALKNGDSEGEEDAVSVPPDQVVKAAKTFHESFGKWKDSLTGIIDSETKNGGRVALWGVGARGVSMLSGLGLPPDYFAYLVDSDSSKHGMFLPFADSPVCSPDQMREDPADVVLVTSYTYFDEIFEQLAWFRSSGGKVIRAYPNPVLVA